MNIFRLEQKGRDYGAIPDQAPAYCPVCYSTADGFNVDFLTTEKINLEKWATEQQRVPIEITCCNDHVVCRTMAQIQFWETLAPHDNEDPAVGEVRKILDLMKKGGLAISYPSTELVEESFLPGERGTGDIWIADGATVEPGARLIAPLLIGTGVHIESGATCGPYAMIVNESLIKSGEEVDHCVIVESQRIFNAGDDALVQKLDRLLDAYQDPQKPNIYEDFPIIATHVNDPLLPTRFNNGTLYVVSLNRSIPGIETLKDLLARLLSQGEFLEDVVFESFSTNTPPSTLTVEVGIRVPVPMIQCIIKSCLDTVAFPLYFALLSEHGKFGYTQRVYFGSRAPSPGIMLSRPKALDFLKVTRTSGTHLLDFFS